ncbi:MAG: phosphate/phosphite/phosphonate ABC transporter substrate-binding protein [Nitrospirae bacterium]|nr:phosphate/phosphite/phosphonate ABC transporter substrate-binding protein [Nitrospirota bacterium]
MGKLEKKVLGVVISVIILGAIFAVTIVIYLQKKNIYETAQEKMFETATVISTSIERTMLEGRAEITKAMAGDLKALKGVETITILNHEGRVAFDRNAPETEKKHVERFRTNLSPYALIENGLMTVYKPLIKRSACQQCHKLDSPFIGVVKVSMTLESEKKKISQMAIITIVSSLFAISVLSLIMWLLLRKIVLNPIKKIEKAARHLADGDLTFNVDIDSTDEIGQASTALQDALHSISSILQRVKDVTKRISKVSSEVEAESRDILEGTQLEAEAISNISSSIEELNAAITEIAANTEELAASSEQTTAAVEEMAASTSQIANNSNELFESSESTSASIEELSSSIKEVALSADELFRSAEDTLSAIEEITASIREVEGNTKESAKLSERVMNEASTYGMTSIGKTIEGMERIKTSVEKTAEYIKKLGGRSEEIGKILTVIDDVTDQTNLLALNAAILAAQAGEHGKGFSVVADEIKDLAERTSFSTQEISSLIQTVQQEVRDAVDAMKHGLEAVNEGLGLSKEASGALKKIVESAQLSSEMSTAIEHSTSEQAEAARFVSRSMENVRNMASQIAKATSEQSRGMNLITNAAEKVKDIAVQVKTATEEQSLQSKQIRKSTDVVSEKSQQIANAINEQKTESEQIKRSVENISDLPVKNRNLSFKVNNSLRSLVKDSELIVTEMESFRFSISTRTKKTLRLGVVPLESPADMYRKFTPLAEYLSRKTGKKVELKVGVDFNSAIEDIGSGVTQFCYMSPSTYIKANRNYGVRVIAKALRDGKPFHHSVIIARSDSPVSSIEGLRNCSFAFGDQESTSSHIVPRYMLLEAGIDLDDLLFYNYLGHHDDVAKAVLSGGYDAGGVMESTADKYREQGLKFIKFSEEIPEFNICITREMTEEGAEEIKSAILALKDTGTEGISVLKSIDEHYTGFVEAHDDDYAWIRDIMSKLKMI